ncbi:hypothetical protein [Agrobacterium pusense]|uniref:hypothetical protein n=1 Tax=Agrobacterium pusense TaxID=648995 RepID=UPI000D3713B9|nr:hypothetical protein [Agrobacterium pusense]PTV70191.1 hypothetical protein DBL06_25340 [Agrobacterium pusense]
MKAFILVVAGTLGAVAVVQSAAEWDDPNYRNKEGWRVCQGWPDATPEQRKQMPDWCEDWATGDE